MFSDDNRKEVKTSKEEQNNVKRYTQKFEKWFLICGVDGLQDRARHRVFACSVLPHNILNTKLDHLSHIGFVEAQDRFIECRITAQNPTQDFLVLIIGDCLRKQARQSIAYFSAMIIQSPVCVSQTIRAMQCTGNESQLTDLLPSWHF